MKNLTRQQSHRLRWLLVLLGCASASGPADSFAVTLPTPVSAGINAGDNMTVASVDVGGRYAVIANLVNGGAWAGAAFAPPGADDVCDGFAYPYTLTGGDNAARVAELRQAIECANLNASDDVIDLDGHTLVFADAPYADADGANALPFVSGNLVLRNGALARDSAQPFRFLNLTDAQGSLGLELMRLSNGSVATEGGALLAQGALTLRKSVFDDNHATLAGGAVAAHGFVGGVTRCSFSGNTAADGAAIAARDFVLLAYSRFSGNGDANSRSVLWVNRYAAILGSLFVDNHPGAADSSLMVFTENNEVAEMRNTTIADNSASGALLTWNRDGGYLVQVRNSIVWHNTYDRLGNVSPWYSIVPGAGSVNGNLDQPPGFVDAPGDYHLDSGSPAIDAGDNANGSPVPPDDGDDGFLAGLLPDLGLDPRPLDDPGVVDTGIGQNAGDPILDLGAYERVTPSAPAGITVAPTSGLVTTESGGTASFTIVLDRYPAANVSLAISSSNPTEGVVAPTSLTFTRTDWNQPRTVTVTGMDDGVADGDQSYTIVTGAAASDDPAYAGMNPPDVTVINTDDDVPAAARVGGSVIGLVGSGLVLRLQEAGETLPMAANGDFAFDAELAPGVAYTVSVDSQPHDPAQDCVVINGSGTIGSGDVVDVVVNCGASGTHSVGGTVSGLAGGGLVLQLNGGSDFAVSGNGDYAFTSRLADGAAYVVTVRTQPQGQLCTLAHAAGTVDGADVSDADVSCAPLQANLYVSVDDNHDFARYGQVRDYFVTLGNNGNVAGSRAISATFDAAFDVANAHWQCLDASAGASCSNSGDGDFHDSASVPPNASVTWVVSVPVLADSMATQATLTIGETPALTTGGLVDEDTDTLVIFRDGLDVPYGDGTQAIGNDTPLGLDNGHDMAIAWPAQTTAGISSVRALDTADGRVEVQRLHFGSADFVRLLGTNHAGRQRTSEWAVVAPGASLVIGRMTDDARKSIVLLEGAAHPLTLSPAAGDQSGDIE